VQEVFALNVQYTTQDDLSGSACTTVPCLTDNAVTATARQTRIAWKYRDSSFRAIFMQFVFVTIKT